MKSINQITEESKESKELKLQMTYDLTKIIS